MRYERVTKSRRNRAVIEYKMAHPELSLEEIGDVFGITKQRVHQLINRGR